MLVRFLHDPPASGAWNMAVDEALLEAAADRDLCTFRIYAWEEPTLSLGYFQQYDDRQRHEASRRCPCLRRASGGGAILHAEEITYSFAVPPSHRWAKKHLEIYDAFHTAIVEVLQSHGLEATLCSPSESEREREPPFLCFQRRSPGDVLVGNEKIGGSAQRRLRGAVVQHGSILFRRTPAAPELPGLNDLGFVGSPSEFLDVWLQKLVDHWHFDLQPGLLSEKERERAFQGVAEKYATESWNFHRGRDVGR